MGYKMRTKTLLIAAVLGAVGIATASAQVTSVNAVGYVNKSLNAGLSLVANPLSNGGNKVSEVIPSAPIGTAIFLFEQVSACNFQKLQRSRLSVRSFRETTATRVF